MNSVRYVGLDVHRDTISAAVLNESGRMIQQSILATRAAAILDFIGGMRGTLYVTRQGLKPGVDFEALRHD
jgi:hypothetical protein